MAAGLAEAGGEVVVMGRNEANGEQTIAGIQAKGGKAQYVKADAANAESLQGSPRVHSGEIGAPSILVNYGGNDPKTTLTGRFHL